MADRRHVRAQGDRTQQRQITGRGMRHVDVGVRRPVLTRSGLFVHGRLEKLWMRTRRVCCSGPGRAVWRS